MIRKLLLILFLLFVLNFNYQPVFRTTLRYKTPVVFVVGTESDTYTSSLIENRKKYYESMKVYLYTRFQMTNIIQAITFNSS